MKQLLLRSSASALMILIASTGVAVAQSDKELDKELDVIIVTGVFKGTKIEDAAVTVSTLNEEALKKLVPVSAADFLKDIPGVFVNSSLGETRNIVSTRGFTANTLDGNNGYFYVSLQEDGLPVQNATAINNNPDHYLRPDIFVDRVEAVRGGGGVVTGPNAPGGVFNYVSRDGRNNPGNEIRARFGFLGEGLTQPFYRLDVYSGGSISENIHYAVGGFYRTSRGSRDPGFAFDEGGQIRGNVIFEYDQGEIKVSGKYLEDGNLFNEFLPVSGLDSLRPLGTFDFNSSVLPSDVRFGFPAVTDDFPVGQPSGSDTFDITNGIQNTSVVVGLDWEHEFGQGWSVSNKAKLSDNFSDWNSGAAIFALPVDTAGLFGPAPFGNGILGVGLSGPGGVVPFTGTISLADSASGQVLAQVQSTTDATGAPVFNLLNSSLPDDPLTPNFILVQTAFAVETGTNEFSNQFVLSKEWNESIFNAGVFFSDSTLRWRSGEGGVGLGQFTPDRQLLDITIERDGADDPTQAGVVQQVTSPDGFAGQGKVGSFNNFVSIADQQQLSLFFTHYWPITEKLSLDYGVRYERIIVDGQNQFPTQFTSTTGGLDGNPNTLFDNTLQTLQAPIRFINELDYFAFSPAVSYDWNERHSTHVRYAQSEKAPSLAAYVGNPSAATDQLIPEKVKQVELVHNYDGDRFDFTIAPFYTELSDVGGFGSPVQFQNLDGTTFTVPTPLFVVETVGVELSGSWDLTDAFNLSGSLTYAVGKQTDNAIIDGGAVGQGDETVVELPDGDAENQADITSSMTGTYTIGDGSVYATWRHLGSRPANAANNFDLPSFNVIDFGASYDITENVYVSGLVKNVFNSRGVLSVQGVGSFDALNRQALAVGPNDPISVQTVQPRAFFVTAGLRF